MNNIISDDSRGVSWVSSAVVASRRIGMYAEPLAWALSRMAPGSWAPILPGESFDDALTRREAARDILDDLLAEYPGPRGVPAPEVSTC